MTGVQTCALPIFILDWCNYEFGFDRDGNVFVSEKTFITQKHYVKNSEPDHKTLEKTSDFLLHSFRGEDFLK